MKSRICCCMISRTRDPSGEIEIHSPISGHFPHVLCLCSGTNSSRAKRSILRSPCQVTSNCSFQRQQLIHPCSLVHATLYSASRCPAPVCNALRLRYWTEYPLDVSRFCASNSSSSRIPLAPGHLFQQLAPQALLGLRSRSSSFLPLARPIAYPSAFTKSSRSRFASVPSHAIVLLLRQNSCAQIPDLCH